MRKLICLLGIVVFCLSGCKDRTGMEDDQLVYDLDLPPGSTNVELLNPPLGSWHTFELDVDGSGCPRRYLRHVTFGDAGKESFSEILPR